MLIQRVQSQEVEREWIGGSDQFCHSDSYSCHILKIILGLHKPVLMIFLLKVHSYQLSCQDQEHTITWRGQEEGLVSSGRLAGWRQSEK